MIRPNCRLRWLICCSAIAALTPSTTSQAGTVTFRPLPGETSSQSVNVEDVSADGSIAVGSYSGLAGSWTLPNVTLNSLHELGQFSSYAYGVSADGGVVVGRFEDEVSPIQAFRWTEAGGQVTLPPLVPGLYAEAAAVSGDGNVAVGSAIGEGGQMFAVVWNGTSPPVLQSDGSPFEYNAFATDVSFNGSVFVGAIGEVAAIWKGSGSGPIKLNPLPNQSGFGVATDVSPDGQFVVGISGANAFMWTEAGGQIDLGRLPGFARTQAHGVSADGKLVVGIAIEPTFGSEAVIRGPAGNWHTLEDFLARHHHPTQWQLERATAISADGKTVVGRGINPRGTVQGFAITIPEPSSWLLLAIGTGLAGVITRLRRNSAG